MLEVVTVQGYGKGIASALPGMGNRAVDGSVKGTSRHYRCIVSGGNAAEGKAIGCVY